MNNELYRHLLGLCTYLPSLCSKAGSGPRLSGNTARAYTVADSNSRMVIVYIKWFQTWTRSSGYVRNWG